MSENTQLAVKPKASDQLAAITGMDRSVMLDAVRAQCFKGNANVSDMQVAAFVSIAAEMGVNPFLPGMLYAFPVSGGGIIPMMGPDGVFKKLAEHPDIDSWEVEIFPTDPTTPPTHATARIFRKGRDKPLTKTCTLAEWKIAQNPNWNVRPRHMLELRTLKQCARQIIHGIPFDEDERHIMGEINVTPEVQAEAPKVDRPTPPPRQRKGPAAVDATPPAPAVEVQATPVAEDTRAAQQKADEAAKAKAVEEKAAQEKATADAKAAAEAKATADKAAEAAKQTPRAFLKDGEILDCVCKVVEAEGVVGQLNGAALGAASLKLEGVYNGPAMHIGGGKIVDDECELLPPWKVGASVKVRLEGKKNEKSGRVSVKVVSAEACQ